MKKVKTFLVLIVLCLLCACQGKDNVDTIEKVGEIVVLQDNIIYVNSPEKVGSYDFELEDVSLIDGYKLGDIVKIKFYEEEKEDLTGKKYKLYHLKSIEPSSGFYENELSLNDIVDFEIEEIEINYGDENYAYLDADANKLFLELSSVKFYKDFIHDVACGGQSFDIEIKGNNKTVLIQDYEVITITLNGETSEYGYHRTDDLITFKDIVEKSNLNKIIIN